MAAFGEVRSTAWKPIAREVELGVQGHPLPHSDSEATLSYVGPCLRIRPPPKKKKTQTNKEKKKWRSGSSDTVNANTLSHCEWSRGVSRPGPEEASVTGAQLRTLDRETFQMIPERQYPDSLLLPQNVCVCMCVC